MYTPHLTNIWTTIIDGKIITFRNSSTTQIPDTISYHLARPWVRVHDLPWKYLDPYQTLRILIHVGVVDTIENNGPRLPFEPYLRVRLMIDLSRPLIPGCFLPLDAERVIWVYFRYKGVYMFCKKCGRVGPALVATTSPHMMHQRVVHWRIQEFETGGMKILHGLGDIYLYTNLIRV